MAILTRTAVEFNPEFLITHEETARVGNMEFRMYAQGMYHYVRYGTQPPAEFANRREAEFYMAAKMAQQKGYDAFFAGKDCKPPVLTPELEADWIEGWEQACVVGESILRDEWYEAESYDEWQPDYSLEDDYADIRTGGW